LELRLRVAEMPHDEASRAFVGVNVATGMLVPWLYPAIKHTAGITSGAVVGLHRSAVAAARSSKTTKGDDDIVAGCSEAQSGMTSDIVVAVGSDALLLAHEVEVAGMMVGHACWMSM
jgi:hypothetical protein